MNCEVCRGACCESFSAEIFMSPQSKDAQRWFDLHSTPADNNKRIFECKCTQLTREGRCAIWDERPMICELFIAGSRECLETVRARRSAKDYDRIRGEDDPIQLHFESTV